jgi:hypothetical protein
MILMLKNMSYLEYFIYCDAACKMFLLHYITLIFVVLYHYVIILCTLI